jgi:transposase-like protein
MPSTLLRALANLNCARIPGGSNIWKDAAMGAKKPSKLYPAELCERAVRLVREQEAEHASQAAAIRSIAEKVGYSAETLRLWLRHAERDRGERSGLTMDELERLKALEREVRELRQANDILRKTRAYVATAERDRRSKPSTAAPSIRFRQEAGASGTGRDCVHRRSPGYVWGRADLPGSADRPIDLPRLCRPACRPNDSVTAPAPGWDPLR